jgi:hypothetical protein
MIRKTIVGVSLAGLLVLGLSARADSTLQNQSGQSDKKSQQQALKSVSGKVAAIGSAGVSFTVEVAGGNSRKTMEFVVNKDTQVQGQVKAGTAVTVEYQAMENGQNLAVSVTAQA